MGNYPGERHCYASVFGTMVSQMQMDGLKRNGSITADAHRKKKPVFSPIAAMVVPAFIEGHRGQAPGEAEDPW